MDSGTAKVHKFGKTALNTSDTGKMSNLLLASTLKSHVRVTSKWDKFIRKRRRDTLALITGPKAIVKSLIRNFMAD